MDDALDPALDKASNDAIEPVQDDALDGTLDPALDKAGDEDVNVEIMHGCLVNVNWVSLVWSWVAR